ncbi:chemotaxis protein CheD [Desulfonatronovibrio magnus]|uniref:chemotaxis protein CheD n=1 Tax=Desulfonatronovibrio magnus TaxID=698827 RepID=UPI0005EB6573|nr:chemotaxis protein CheD [Desulfonatronovibrio magnus]
MSESIQTSDYYLHPGYVSVPAEPTRLAAVAASGVVVTLYDAGRRCGGMGHYIRPIRQDGLSTTVFAAPAIVVMAKMLFAAGCEAGNLTAYIFGGAENPGAGRYVPGLGQENVQVGEEVLDRLGIALTGKDVGGTMARKILFHSATGETVVARVEKVRETDWYPDFKLIQEQERSV